MIFEKQIANLKRKRLKKAMKYNIKMFLLFFGVIMVWRSLWNFLEVFIFPGNFLLSNLVTLLIGLLIIYIDEYSLEDVV